MPDVITKLKNLVNELGMGDGSLYLLTMAIHKVTGRVIAHRYHVVAQAVPAQPGKLLARNKKFSIREVNAQQYQQQWFPPPAAVIQQRFNQGCHCLVAFDGDQPAACLWLALAGYYEDEVRCHFIPTPAEHSAWDFDVYIKPEYQLSRCFAYLWDFANCWLRERNIDWCMSRINAFNPASFTAHRRLGAKIVGDAAFFHLGPLQLTYRDVHSRNAAAENTGGDKTFDLSFKSTPVIYIAPSHVANDQ